jgi:Fe2+ transport system protein B
VPALFIAAKYELWVLRYHKQDVVAACSKGCMKTVRTCMHCLPDGLLPAVSYVGLMMLLLQQSDMLLRSGVTHIIVGGDSLACMPGLACRGRVTLLAGFACQVPSVVTSSCSAF